MRKRAVYKQVFIFRQGAPPKPGKSAEDAVGTSMSWANIPMIATIYACMSEVIVYDPELDSDDLEA